MNVVKADDRTFDSHIRKEGTTLVEFGASWCPPCKALLPVLEQIAAERQGQVNVLQMDCDESTEVPARFGILSMPTVLLFHRGEAVEKLVGLRPKSAYESLLAKYAAEPS